MKKQPEFLSLTQDLVFKSFFSRNKQVLLSLIRTFLPISNTISDVEILNPEERDQLHIVNSNIPPDVKGGKLIVMDLRVKLISGENINIEMQTFPQKGFLKRILLYWSRLYPQDLEEGGDFEDISPAYSLVFTTFTILGKEMKNCVNPFFAYAHKAPHSLFNEDFNIIVVELNKLPENYEELSDLYQKWCYLIKRSDKLTEAEIKDLSKDLEMKMALEHLSKISEDQRLKQAAITREKTELDHKSRLASARKEGMEKGMEKVALRMLKDGYKLPAISKMTGLSGADIEGLE